MLRIVYADDLRWAYQAYNVNLLWKCNKVNVHKQRSYPSESSSRQCGGASTHVTSHGMKFNLPSCRAE